MTGTPDWVAWEERIEKLLPGRGRGPESSSDRRLLLDEVSTYARAATREARRAGFVLPTDAQREQAIAWLGRPVFLCGHHRSGTTLLRNLLDGHPDLVVLPDEGTYFTSFRYAARARPTSQDVDRFLADWIARFVDPNHEPHFKLGRSGPPGNPSVLFARRLLGWHEEVLQAWPTPAPFALLLSLMTAFNDLVPTSGTPRRWVEKTPLNERYVERLAVFPDARFIQLIRDPSATLASLLELHSSGGKGKTDAGRDARCIGRSLRLAQRNLRRLPERYLVVRYEDLVGDPARETDRVRAFIGIRPHVSLTTPTVLGRPVRANSSFDPGDAGVISRSRPTRALSPTEATLVGAFTEDSARALGYDVRGPAVLKRAALLLREEIRHVSRHIRTRIANARAIG
jgi:hypothetical protein